MIKIDKGNAPQYLLSEKVMFSIDRIKEFYSTSNRTQKRYAFPFNREFDREIKTILHEHSHGKCAYCETKIPSPEYGTIDRFRPHNGVRDNKEYFKDLYWWLCYDWDNLIYSCKDCNQYKANYFPIAGERALSPKEQLENERKLLINPYTDDPVNHLQFSIDGTILSNTESGKATIQLLKLNRENLLFKRKKAIDELKLIIDELQIKGSISSENEKYIFDIYTNNPFVEFLSLKKQFLLSTINDNDFFIDLLNLINFDKVAYGEQVKLITGQVYEKYQPNFQFDNYYPIESIRIKNFKAISDITLNFKEDEINHNSWLFLLGENGVGKSSILQAIAIGLKPTLKTGDKMISEFIRSDQDEAEIRIKIRNSSDIIITTLHKTNRINHTGNFNSFLLGYGSYRLPFHKDLKTEKKSKVRYSNLLDYSYSLNDSYTWLLNLYSRDKTKFDIVATALLELLPDSNIEREIIRKNGKLVFSDKPDIEITNHSEGFKSVLSLALDILMTLSVDKVDIELLSGIIIIDELGNQLHPQWQMKIVTKLRKVFPKIQFIVSSHNPLCLRGIEEGEVILLKENEEKKLVLVENLPDPNELSIEQILKSEFFGLNSTNIIEDQKYFEYYQLLIRKNRNEKLSESEEANYKDLRTYFRSIEKHLGNSLREDLIFDAVDQMIAQQYLGENKLSRNDLSKKTKELFLDLWENDKSNDKN
jgi:uncharacterized protein (TIGR02646 family)